MGAYSQRFEDALALAGKAHRNQLRSGSDIPHLTHPVHVARILTYYGYDEDVIIAGLLHEVIEHCGVLPQELADRFGLHVAEIVASLSAQQHAVGGLASRQVRNAAQLSVLRTAPLEAIVVQAADLLHSLLSTYADLEREGEEAWLRLRHERELSMEHYRAVVAAIEERVGEHPLVRELKQALKAVEETAGALS